MAKRPESEHADYRQEAVFLRDLAAIAKSAEARQELLQLAAAYERLGRLGSRGTHAPALPSLPRPR